MKVLVTRLEADGKRTASKLLEAGFEPVLMPLTELRSSQCPVVSSKPDFAIFTSAHGVELLPLGQDEVLRSQPVYAVGPSTANVLRLKSYTDIRIGPGTAAGLAELVIREQCGLPTRGHYYCGHERAFDFVAAFNDSGIRLDLCEVYSIENHDPDADVVRAVLEEVQGGAALVYSANGAKRLAEVTLKHGSSHFPADLTVVAISEHAALALRQFPVGRIVIADEPTESGMIEALHRSPA